MNEKTFVRFHEINQNEGEAWNWWLQLDGNQAELSKLEQLLTGMEDEEDEPSYEFFPEDVERESVVDKLVEYAESGYYHAHNKVAGVFTCPDDLGETGEKLYKGGIRDLFQAAAARELAGRDGDTTHA